MSDVSISENPKVALVAAPDTFVDGGRPTMALLLLNAFHWFEDQLLLRLPASGGPRLTQRQALLLARVPADGRRPADIARAMGISRQAAHQVLKELTKLGLVQLGNDPSSGRSRLVRRTVKGMRVHEEVRGIVAEFEQRLADRIGPRNAAMFRETLEMDWGPAVLPILESLGTRPPGSE